MDLFQCRMVFDPKSARKLINLMAHGLRNLPVLQGGGQAARHVGHGVSRGKRAGGGALCRARRGSREGA